MNADERAEIAQQFGVAPEQVERDHLISHLLAFLSKNFSDRIQFIGGTALARTHLPHGRLSEDIDLIAIDVATPWRPIWTRRCHVHWLERTAGSPWIRRSAVWRIPSRQYCDPPPAWW